MKIQEDIEKFHNLIKNQMDYGGKKYALSEQRESTDELFDAHGKNWLFGTCDKYCYRFRNLARERDLLKIPCYMYILWLKRGFFIKKEGLTDVLDTNIETKEKYFNQFKESVSRIIEEWRQNTVLDKLQNRSDEHKLELVSSTLKSFSSIPFADVKEDLIISIYFSCFLVWFAQYSHLVRHDEDLENEADRR